MLKYLLLGALSALYLTSLGSVGFLGPDEPRYASIGRAMAVSGDWITPRLDGQPWFEKPPLLYWMTASGNLLGLSDEWAARLPVAIAGLAFLFFFFHTLEREFNRRVALYATAILGTSAGWSSWAFDQFCLNSRPIPLEAWTQARATAVAYHKPRAARALEATVAVPVVSASSGAMNRFKLNEGKLNG